MTLNMLHGGNCGGLVTATDGEDGVWTIACDACGDAWTTKDVWVRTDSRLLTHGQHHDIYQLLPVWEEDPAQHPEDAELVNLSEKAQKTA